MSEVASAGVCALSDVILTEDGTKTQSNALKLKKLKMGTDEKDLELAVQDAPKEQESPGMEKESTVESPQGQSSESTDPLNTYKWHTGSRGTLNEVKGEGQGEAASSTSTISKFQKASANKWNKMQNWRKALSEDPGDKNPSNGKGGEGGKTDKSGAGSRRNPFKRAMSEPPGSLTARLALSTSNTGTASSTPAGASSAAAKDPGVSSTDSSHKGGGGMPFKKYLRTVSQKFKRPRLMSRSSTPNMMPGTAANCHHTVVKHLLIVFILTII